MKNISCFQFGAGLFGKRLAYAGYEEALKASVESIKPEEKAEKLPTFDDVQANVDAKLNAAEKQQQDAVKTALDTQNSEEKKALDAMPEKTPKEKGEKKKAKEKYDAAEESRKKAYEKAVTDIGEAKKNARAAVEKRYTDFADERKKKAGEWAESTTKLLVESKLQKVSFEDREKDIKARIGDLGMDFSSEVTMQTYAYEGKTGESKEMGTTKWKEADVKEATIALLQSIYYEEGKDEAMKKAKEIMDTRHTLKEAYEGVLEGRNVNYFVLKEATGGVNGAFDIVHRRDLCPPTKPRLFGRVVGYIDVANRLFANEEDRKKYEAYVRDAVKKGAEEGDLKSPSDWALKNAPAVLKEKREPQKLIDDVVNSIVLPSDKDKYKEPGNTWQDKEKAWEAKKNAALQRREDIKAYLEGVVASETDPAKQDVLIKKALQEVVAKAKGADMNTYEFKLEDLNQDLDFKGIVPGKEVNIAAEDFIDESSKKYLFGKMAAAFHGYGSEKVTVGGKEQLFYDYYKSYLETQLKQGSPAYQGLDLADRALLHETRGKKDEKEIAEAEERHRNKVRKILEKYIKKPGELLTEAKKPPEPEKPASPDKATDDQKKRADDKVREAQAAYEKKDYDTAGKAYQEAYKVVEDPNTHLGYVRTLNAQKNYDEAVMEAQKLVDYTKDKTDYALVHKNALAELAKAKAKGAGRAAAPAAPSGGPPAAPPAPGVPGAPQGQSPAKPEAPPAQPVPVASGKGEQPPAGPPAAPAAAPQSAPEAPKPAAEAKEETAQVKLPSETLKFLKNAAKFAREHLRNDEPEISYKNAMEIYVNSDNPTRRPKREQLPDKYTVHDKGGTLKITLKRRNDGYVEANVEKVA